MLQQAQILSFKFFLWFSAYVKAENQFNGLEPTTTKRSTHDLDISTF